MVYLPGCTRPCFFCPLMTFKFLELLLVVLWSLWW
ncbi:hypothetical protein LCGC14_1722520, partial [marine sediment metagenome]